MLLFLSARLSSLIIGLMVSTILYGQSSKKIYLREFSVAPEFSSYQQILEKNIYDVIMETARFELYLVDDKSKDYAFMTGYERLNVSVEEDVIKVNLSKKIVVVRRYEFDDPPVLDLRIALYELFFGKEFVKKNLDRIVAASRKRIKQIERVHARQLLIDGNSGQKLVSQNSANNMLNPSASSKPNSSKKAESLKAQSKTNQAKLSSPNKPVKNNVSNAAKNPVSKPVASSNASQTKNSEKNSKSSTPPGSDSEAQSSAFPKQVDGKARPPKVVKGQVSTRASSLISVIGFTNYQANYEEFISTVTTLNFYTLGLRYKSFLNGKNPRSNEFMDYDVAFFLLQPKTTEKYKSPKGRKVFLYAGYSTFANGLGGGVSASYENSQLALLKDINQGLVLADIDFLFVGPELRYDFKFKSMALDLQLKYKMSLTSSSDFKAQFDARAVSVMTNIWINALWGIELKYDQQQIVSSRTRANGEGQSDLLNIGLNFRF